MPTKSYHTVNGRIIGQTTNGVRQDFLTDALGSVTATASANGAVENRYRYKPYGARLSKTGLGQDPRFEWVGSLGYRTTPTSSSDRYVRYRHYGVTHGLWTSPDPIRSSKTSPYSYVEGRCTNDVDPTGLIPVVGGPGCDSCASVCGYKTYFSDLNKAIDKFCRAYLEGGEIRQKVDNCAKGAFKEGCIKTFCEQTGTVIKCQSAPSGINCKPLDDNPLACPKDRGCTGTSAKLPALAETTCISPGSPLVNTIVFCCPDWKDYLKQCCCPSSVRFSEEDCRKGRPAPIATLLHELYHACASEKGCAKHDGPQPWPHNEFRDCVSKAFSPPLF
jgi:RHS repeat-associated protein